MQAGPSHISRKFFVSSRFRRRKMLQTNRSVEWRYKSASLHCFTMCRANEQMFQLTTENSLSKSDPHIALYVFRFIKISAT